ncbi:hypothetical protein XENOCAPTIV_024793 [Xenoophorus captivus]|uniref:Uncharacterized protein n=1 Tax=Xenoophorus captivus TaxID=1517983 RepID=A0ABV0RS19_9TELE
MIQSVRPFSKPGKKCLSRHGLPSETCQSELLLKIQPAVCHFSFSCGVAKDCISGTVTTCGSVRERKVSSEGKGLKAAAFAAESAAALPLETESGCPVCAAHLTTTKRAFVVR